MSRCPSAHRRSGTARGDIEAQAIYPLAVFLRRLGIGRHSLTALRRQGLPVHAIGTRLFVDGGEAIDTLRRIWAADQRPHGNGNKQSLGSTECEPETE
jgi:hypothetical protein